MGRIETRVIGLGKRGVVGLAVRMKARRYRSWVQCGSEGLSVLGAVWKRGVIGLGCSVEARGYRSLVQCGSEGLSVFRAASRMTIKEK